jgi:hypothetical protein
MKPILIFLSLVGVVLQSSAAIPPAPLDPWRIIDGSTNYAGGKDWVYLTGKVWSHEGGGVVVSGGVVPTIRGDGTEAFSGHYFVANWNCPTSDGKSFMNAAGPGGPIAKHRHQLVKTSFGSIRLLDYGAVWKPSPEWTKQQEVKAAEAKAEAAKAIQAKQASAESAGLRYNRSQADKGDMQGLFRMGQRYASGDGVDKDPAKARAFFQSALSAGHPDAAKALAAVQD